MLVNRRTSAAIGAVALAGALLSAGPAQADSTAPSPATSAKASKPAPKGDGAKSICKRLPKTESRISTALTRLNGDATVRVRSPAWSSASTRPRTPATPRSRTT